MGAHLHQPNQLLALAIFVDSLKTAYVRSIHVHEEKVGSLYTIQQDFLLNPGEYASVSQPVMSAGSFRTCMLGTGVKQIMGAIIKMHVNDGWHCVLAYRSDSPSESTLPFVLTPSRNVDLKSIPSLEQDLKLVENALSSSSRNARRMLVNDEIITSSRSCGEGKTTPKGNCGWFSSNLILSCPSGLTLLDHSIDHLPGLETPGRTPHGQQLDIWHDWGAELELASPRLSCHRTSHANQALNSSSPMSSQNAAYPGALWNPSTMLDLNLDLTEFASQDNNVDCALLLSSPVSEPMSFLNLELGTPTLSLNQSTVMEHSMDCFTLECFGDSPACYNIAAVDPNTKLPKSNAAQNTKSMCSEDSVCCHGSVINVASSEVNVNSSMTSGEMYSAVYKKKSECINGNMIMPSTDVNGNSSMRSSDVYSAAYMMKAGCTNQCLVSIPSSEVNGNSSMTSSDIYCAAFNKKNAGCIQGNEINVLSSEVDGNSSSDMYFAAYKKNAGCIVGDKVFKDSPAISTDSWRGRESSRRACSSGSTQSVQQLTSNADTDSKPRIIRPGSTSERITEITLQELSQHFSMPITQASKELKVGLTVLKKRCREFNIPRWPHRKIKSVDSLINNIQDLAKDQGVKTSPRVQNAVKELEEQKRLMEKMPGVELADRTKKLRQACFKANYKKRRLGMMISNTACMPLAGVPRPSTMSRSFNALDQLNPTFIIPSPPNRHTIDQFL